MRPNKNDKLKQQYRVNEQIRAREVRVIPEEGDSVVMPVRDALRMAQQQGVDLVEISPNAEPPVCRLVDFSKFIYQQKKRQKELKAKQVKVEVKEIRFGPQTDDHDYNFKLKHAKGFLSEGDKVKAYVFFRGRSILFKEQGEVLLLRFANDLEEYGKVESMPVLEGKRMTMYISPKKAPVRKEDIEIDTTHEVEAEAETTAAPAKKAPKWRSVANTLAPKLKEKTSNLKRIKPHTRNQKRKNLIWRIRRRPPPQGQLTQDNPDKRTFSAELPQFPYITKKHPSRRLPLFVLLYVARCARYAQPHTLFII